MAAFDAFETAALDALLEGDHPVLEQLRRQRAAATVRRREANEFGQFTDLWVNDEVGAIDVTDRFAIDDVYARVEGLDEEVALLLHIVRGRLKSLEAFVPRPVWPTTPIVTERWYVRPDAGDAGQLHRIDARDLAHGLRGLDAERE